jgi:hypothetical protein
LIWDSLRLLFLRSEPNFLFSFVIFKLFNGNISDYLEQNGTEKLKQNLKLYFDAFIDNKLNINDYNLINTFGGMQFMSLDRTMFLKIQSIINLLEESITIIDKIVVMFNDKVIWSGIEQQDISVLYKYFKDLIIKNNLNTNNTQSMYTAKFLVDSTLENIIDNVTNTKTNETEFELNKIFIGDPLEQYYLVPYNSAKITFFMLIKAKTNVRLIDIKKIDELLGSNLVNCAQEINELQIKRGLLTNNDRDFKYIYFNKMNLAQKSTIDKELSKNVLNLIADLSIDLNKLVIKLTLFL